MNIYPAYKDSGEQWLGQIPEHWEMKPGLAVFRENKEKNSLGQENTVLSLSYGKIIVKENKNEGLVPAEYTSYQIVHPDYIIIRCTDLQNDKVSLRTGLVKDDGIITSAYLGLIVKADNPAYIHYFLHALDITKEIYRYGSGLRQSLSWVDFKRLNVLLPPIDEQEKIVAYLNEQTEKIDQAIERQQKMIDLLEERKQIIIQHAVTKGLNPNAKMKNSGIEWIGEIPEGWNKKRFKYMFQTSTGVSFTKDQLESEGNPVLSYGQVHSKLNKSGTLNEELIKFIPNSLVVGKDNCLVYKGDFIFADTSEDFEGCGNNIYVDTDYPVYAGYHTIIARKQNDEYGKYLGYLFASRPWRGQVRTRVNGVKVYSITQGILNGAWVILPPKGEQMAIADYLDKVVGIIDKEEIHRNRLISLLRERKQIIINEVVTGKIKVS